MKFISVADLVDPDTGKTYRQQNIEKQHGIAVGELVEVKYSQWHGDGACEKVHARLWVVLHTRDCDGTPMYSLSQWRDVESARQFGPMVHGFDERDLTVVEVTERLRYGHEALEWDDV